MGIPANSPTAWHLCRHWVPCERVCSGGEGRQTAKRPMGRTHMQAQWLQHGQVPRLPVPVAHHSFNLFLSQSTKSCSSTCLGRLGLTAPLVQTSIYSSLREAAPFITF